VFCDEQISSGRDTPVYRLYDETRTTPVFCYETIENVIIPTREGESTYVPYEQVRDNEFFANDKETLDAWDGLKGMMIRRYGRT
jgi:hypothetical protein